jgi:hypothetical protein
LSRLGADEAAEAATGGVVTLSLAAFVVAEGLVAGFAAEPEHYTLALASGDAGDFLPAAFVVDVVADVEQSDANHGRYQVGVQWLGAGMGNTPCMGADDPNRSQRYGVEGGCPRRGRVD